MSCGTRAEVDGFADRRVGRCAAVQDRRASACRSPSAFPACRAFETTLRLLSCQAARQPPGKLRSERWRSTVRPVMKISVTQDPEQPWAEDFKLVSAPHMTPYMLSIGP